MTTSPNDPDFYERAVSTLEFGESFVKILSHRKPREGWSDAQAAGRATLKADLPGIWAQAQAQATMALVEAVERLTEVLSGEDDQ